MTSPLNTIQLNADESMQSPLPNIEALGNLSKSRNCKDKNWIQVTPTIYDKLNNLTVWNRARASSINATRMGESLSKNSPHFNQDEYKIKQSFNKNV